MYIMLHILDNSKKWQCFFQEPATLIMENIITLHNDILFFLIVIIYIVLWFITAILIYWSKGINFNSTYKSWKNFTHNKWLEIIWTIIPTIILLLISLPSFMVLYQATLLTRATITVKVIGQSWWWLISAECF